MSLFSLLPIQAAPLYNIPASSAECYGFPCPDMRTFGTIQAMPLPSSNEQFTQRNLRFNLTVNLLDGGFFWVRARIRILHYDHPTFRFTDDGVRPVDRAGTRDP